MGKKKDNIDKILEDIELYTTLTFSNDDINITIKNISLGMLELYTDKKTILQRFMYKLWFMNGVYETVNIEGVDYIILKRTKKNIELMVKDKYDFEELSSN